MSLSLADVALVIVVTGMATAMAYLRSPRAKSLAYMLPLPFSAAVVSSGQAVDFTHVAAVALVCAYPWVVRLAHVRAGMNIVAANVLALASYLAAGIAVARLVSPATAGSGLLFWPALALLSLGSLPLLALPHRAEPGHRSPLPAWLKLPAVLLIVLGIIAAKEPLRGFMPCFPFATIFAVHESRRSLYTLGARMPIFALGFAPMLALYRALEPRYGPFASLAAGWAVYMPVYVLLDAFYRRKAVGSGDQNRDTPASLTA